MAINPLEALQETVLTLQGEVNTLKEKLAAVQASNVQALDPFVSVDPNPRVGVAGPHIIFSGANIHIVSGSGATDDGGTPRGLGNLIIGYDEDPTGLGSPLNPGDRGGSHNLVIGARHKFTQTAFGGLVAGDGNTISNTATSISSGQNNTASGNFASVSGGLQSTASGSSASVSGGKDNTAEGGTTFGDFATSVSGGQANKASGSGASVSGGSSNGARGPSSSISGGSINDAFGSSSSVTGGQANKARGTSSSVSGGENNTAQGDATVVLGGQSIVDNGSCRSHRSRPSPDGCRFRWGHRSNPAGPKVNAAAISPRRTGENSM